MLLLRLWNYIRGYVIILVEGYFLEKFINICIHRQIFLWDIKKLKSSTMRLKVSINGFKLLRPVAKKTGCRVRIIEKKGIPFTVNKYRRRKTFLFGALIFIVLLYGLTSFIWTIEITGNKSLGTEIILEKLEAAGIKQGILKYNIDTDRIVDNMMLDIKELAWIGISIRGTKVKVEIEERVQPPELVSKDVPCDIVAQKDGVVKAIIAKAGQEAVKVGDTVTEGQVLISGAVQTKNEQINTRLVHALGSVKARTWYEGRQLVDPIIREKVRTGQKKDRYSIVLFIKRFDFGKETDPFEDYDRVEIKKRISLGKDNELPFEFIIDRYYENNIVERDIGMDEAKTIAMDEAYNKASVDIQEGAEIVDSRREFVTGEDNNLYAAVTIECVEEIGVAKEIGGK